MKPLFFCHWDQGSSTTTFRASHLTVGRQPFPYPIAEELPVNRLRPRFSVKTYLGYYGSMPSAPRASLDGPAFNDGHARRPNHLHHRKARFLKEGPKLRFGSLSAARQDHHQH